MKAIGSTASDRVVGLGVGHVDHADGAGMTQGQPILEDVVETRSECIISIFIYYIR
jgi:hypothetical protein